MSTDDKFKSININLLIQLFNESLKSADKHKKGDVFCNKFLI